MSHYKFCLLASALLLVAWSSRAVSESGNMVSMAGQRFSLHKLTKRRDLDPQTCVDNFDIHRDKIIRTEDSREMGAKYLNEIDLGSRDECLRLCCETESCDVFVFEEKSPGSCYLFHCGPPEDFKCKFTRHTNFSSAVLAINRHLAELEDQIKLTKHEQDLASLRKQVQESATVKAVTVVPVHKKTQPIVTVPPVRRCSRFQFECHSSQECIAIYNACDGIPQCADGSDEAPELGCPATTTLSAPQLPPAMPPREILPQMQQIQQMPIMPQYAIGDSLQKESPLPPRPPPFMRPLNTAEGPAWPRRLEQLPTNNQLSHIKQFNDNVESSRIFNHKGGLQVTEADSVAAGQYDYKSLPYDSAPESGWPHRTWPQQQPDQINVNDGSPIYHNMEVESQNVWKQQQQQQQQQQLQNMPMPHRMKSMENQMMPQRMQTDKMTMQGMPNIFQDREKMWAVPQNQENQPIYPQNKLSPVPEAPYQKIKQETEKQQPTQAQSSKNNNESSTETEDKADDDADDDSDAPADTNKDEEPDKKPKHSKDTKKHAANKAKKKHLVSEHEKKEEPKKEVSKGDKNTEAAMSEQILIAKLYSDDTHDGAAERPPGAILLLTLGVCMTSIMVVLLGCRLKMARRRMRRSGKSPFAHDSDYLVNGMYL